MYLNFTNPRMSRKRARVVWDIKENRALPIVSTSFRFFGLKEDATAGVFVSSKELQLHSFQGPQGTQNTPLDTHTRSMLIKRDHMVLSKKSSSLINNYLVTWQQGYVSNIHQRYVQILHLETQRAQDVSVVRSNIHPGGFVEGYIDSNGEYLVLFDENKNRLWCWRDINGECFGGSSSKATDNNDIGQWNILPLFMNFSIPTEITFFEGAFFFSSILGSIFVFCTVSILQEDTICRVDYWTFQAENEWHKLSHLTWNLELNDLEASEPNSQVIIQLNLQYIAIIIGRNIFVLASTCPDSIKSFELNQKVVDAVFVDLNSASDSIDSDISLALLQADDMLQLLSGITGDSSNSSLQGVELELVDTYEKSTSSTTHQLLDLNHTMSSSSTKRVKPQHLYWSSTVKKLLVLAKERTGNGSFQMILGQFTVQAIQKELGSFLDFRYRQQGLQEKQAAISKKNTHFSRPINAFFSTERVKIEEKFKEILDDKTVANWEEKIIELLELARQIVSPNSQAPNTEVDLLWTILQACYQYFIQTTWRSDLMCKEKQEKAHMELLFSFFLPLDAAKIHEWSQKAIHMPCFTSQKQRKRYFQKEIQELMHLQMDNESRKSTKKTFMDVFFSSFPQLLLKFCCQSNKSDEFPLCRSFTQLLREGKAQEALGSFQQFVREDKEKNASENTDDQQLLRLLGAYTIMSEQLQMKIPLVVPVLQDAVISSTVISTNIIHKKDFFQSSLCLIPLNSEAMERAVDRTLGTTALEAVVHLLLQKNRLPELFTIVDFCLQSDSVLKNDRLQQVCNIAIESIRSTTSTSNTEKIIIQRLLVKQLFVYIIQKKLEKLCGKLQTKSLLFCKKQQDFRTTEEVSITRILKNHEKLFYDCIAGYNNKDEKVLKEVQDILWLMKAFLSQKSLIKSTPSYSASGSSYTSDNIFIVRLLMDVLYTKQIQTNDDKNGPEITRTKTDIQQQSSSFCLFFHQLLTMSSNDEKDNTKQVKLANAFWGLSDNEINLPAVLTDVVDPTVPKMIRTFVLYVWSLWIHEKSSIVLEYIRQSAGRQLNPEPKNSATRTRRLGRVCVSLSMELHSYTLVVPNKKEEISLLQMELLENAVLWHPELTSHVLGSFFSVFPLHSKVFKRFSKLKRSIGMHLHLSVTDDEARRTLSSTCTELKRKTKQMVDKMVEKCIFSSCSDGLQLHVVRAGGGGVGEGGKEGTDENVHVQDEQLGIYLSTCCSNYNFRRLCFQLFTKKGEYSLRPATAARKNTSSNFLSDQVGLKEIQKLLQKQRNELDKKIQDLRFDLQQQKQQNQQNQQSIPVNKTKAFVSNTCINSIDSSEKNNPTTFVKDVAELARQMYEEDHKTDISRKEIINTSKKTDNTSKSPQNFVLKLFQLNKKNSNHEKNLEGFFQSFDEKEPTKEDSPTKLLSDRPNVETQNKCSSNTKALVTPLRYTEMENVDLNSAKLKLLKTRSRVRNQAISLIDKDFIAPPTPDYKESKGYKRVLSELTQEAVIRAVDATTQACILKNTSAQTDAIQPDQIDIKTESSDAITALQNSEASQIVVSPSISTHQKLPEKQEQISRSPQCEKNEPKECIVSGVQCSLDLNDRAERQRRRIQQRLSSFLDFSLTCTSINRCPTASSKNYLKIVSVPFDTDNEKQLMEVDAVDGSVRPTPRPRFSLQLDIPSTCEQPLKNEIDPTSQPEAVSIQEQWQVYGDTIVLGTLSDSETVELKGSLKRLEETLTNPNPPVVDTTTIDLFRFGLNQGAVREESVPEGTRNRTILNDMKEMKKRLEILEKCADEIDQDFDESHRKIQLAEAQHQELVHQSRSKRIMKTLDFLQEQVEEDLASSNHRAMKEDQKDLTRSDTITTNSTGNEGNAVKAGILSQKASKDAMKARKLVEQIEAFVRK